MYATSDKLSESRSAIKSVEKKEEMKAPRRRWKKIEIKLVSRAASTTTPLEDSLLFLYLEVSTLCQRNLNRISLNDFVCVSSSSSTQYKISSCFSGVRTQITIVPFCEHNSGMALLSNKESTFLRNPILDLPIQEVQGEACCYTFSIDKYVIATIPELTHQI